MCIIPILGDCSRIIKEWLHGYMILRLGFVVYTIPAKEVAEEVHIVIGLPGLGENVYFASSDETESRWNE